MLKSVKQLYEDARNIMKKDPAARNLLEVLILYPRFSYINFL